MARDDGSARYRQAAQLALEQLDWCIDYLRTNKPKIARQLAKNRSTIGRRLEHHDTGGDDTHRPAPRRE